MQTGLTIPANECAGHPSSRQEHTCWLIACLCWREHWFGWVVDESAAAKCSFIVKKACQVFGVCLRLSYKAPHHPQPYVIPLPFAVLLSDVCVCMFPESCLTSEVELYSSILAMIHHTHQLSRNINWKGQKAVRHFLTYQFDFRQRSKTEGWGTYICLLMFLLA